LQLISAEHRAARGPKGIDMVRDGKSGQVLAYCIAEHEEANPWEPFPRPRRGFKPEQSTVTLFFRGSATWREASTPRACAGNRS